MIQDHLFVPKEIQFVLNDSIEIDHHAYINFDLKKKKILSTMKHKEDENWKILLHKLKILKKESLIKVRPKYLQNYVFEETYQC